MKTYPVLVLAGYSTEKPDPLAIALGVERKSLIPIAGKPMVYWVVKALRESKRIDQIYIVGMGPEDGVDFGTDVIYIPNQNAHFDNIMAGVKAVQDHQPEAEFLVTASGDIPLLHPETVDWFVETCEKQDGDLFYSVVERSVMETAFPDSRRSYVPVVEGKFCGGDLFFVRIAVVHNNEQLVRELLAKRKSPLQQARLLGFKTIIKFLFRRLSIKDAEDLSKRLLNAEGHVVVSPYADLAMDVDKPHQLDMVRERLEALVGQADDTAVAQAAPETPEAGA
jgi:CMP-2-keto-3-deoxyoctulosonic acid synthetase